MFSLPRFTRLAVGILALAFASTASAEDKKPIVIGVAGPMTQRAQAYGAQIKYGVDFAKRQIEKEGGLLGRPVEFLIKDDEGNSGKASLVAQELASNPDLVAVVGHFNSDCSKAGKGTYTAAKIVMFSPASTNVQVTQDTDWVFRNIFNDRFQGQTLATYISKRLHKSKVAVLYENDAYGKGLRDDFLAQAKVEGLAILRDLSYEQESSDFRPLLTAIKDTKPEMLVICGLYQQGGLIAKQARELGITANLIGGDGLYDETLMKTGGRATEGFIVTCPFLEDLGGERFTALKASTTEHFAGENANSWAALAYDAAMMIAEAIRKTGRADRQAIRDYLASVDTPEEAFDGIAGKTYFDKEGDCLKAVHIAMVKGGKFVPAPIQMTDKK